VPIHVRGKQSDRWLKLSHDRKVSPRGYQQPGGVRPGRWIATVPNSFGLPAGVSCPGRTPFCESCYAVGSEQRAGVAELVQHNLRLLTEAGTVDAMTHLLAEMVGRYTREAERLALPPADRLFRIHWDGDFFSIGYATAWARVIRGNPAVKFWAYTRSFVPPVDVVPILADIDNLALYLSADQWNIGAARAQCATYGVHLAVCTVDYRTGRKLAGERRAVVCPENNGRLPLMDNGRGACVECRLCPDGRRDVIFSTSHLEDASAPSRITQQEAKAAGQCANPDCAAPLVALPGRGRPPKWCSDQCRWKVYRRAKAAERRSA
jgi:hypothetical protein